ncbi:HVO_0416 family zinc finger protein [Haloarchaeobius sp. TZWWS8]|uniref:HVO_0416 family zinc finger protein n=1 Tax=Haloarchaeobius sp. TZWWS8 TaxID=3446121 RepID=UPI003EBAC9B8
MASAPQPGDDVFDQFLADRGHETEPVGWDRSYNKLQCPECMSLHEEGAHECTVCDWQPN